MFAETVVNFADYLNQMDYSVTSEKIEQCISSFSDDTDCMDINDVIGTMRFYFCTNQVERDSLPDYFKSFLKEKEKLANAEKNRQKIKENEFQKERNIEKHNQAQNALNDKIKSLREKEEEIRQKVIREWKMDESLMTKADKKFLDSEKKWIKGLKDETVNTFVSGQGLSSEELLAVQKKIIKRTEDSIRNGKIADVKKLNQLFKILNKVRKYKENEVSIIESAVKKATKETTAKIKELKERKRFEQENHDKEQNELTKAIKKLQSDSLIVKPSALHHREEFKNAKNAVQTLTHIECPPEAEKEFKQLSSREKSLIYRYIKDNILKFKTRLTRNIANFDNGTIDMGKTIKNACRTGGLPMDIFKELKRPGKSNLILILDVSGSCKEASEMMLTFMYLLQSVFPRGCKAFAFVNSLYDITDIMHTENPEQAICTALNLIPRRGVYSNYERPIIDMWENHKSSITKDSFVIIIGDARNNKNGAAESEFKNIVRRAKKTYWMNTDKLEKWGQGDSIAQTYARYCKMFETRTPKAIVQFLNEMK